jgi:hypothetical protein
MATAQARRHTGLAKVVAAPGDDTAILFERHRVIASCYNGHYAALRGGWHRALAIIVLAPGEHSFPWVRRLQHLPGSISDHQLRRARLNRIAMHSTEKHRHEHDKTCGGK